MAKSSSIDLSKLSLDELESLAKDIETEVTTRRQAERDKVFGQMRAGGQPGPDAGGRRPSGAGQGRHRRRATQVPQPEGPQPDVLGARQAPGLGQPGPG